MKIRGFILMVILAFSFSCVSNGDLKKGEKEKTIVIFANKDKDCSNLNIDKIRRIFLKKSSEDWVALNRREDIRKAFRNGVVKMDEIQLKEFWRKMKTTEGVGPPKAYRSLYTVLKLVGEKKNTISYYLKEEITKKRKKRYKKLLGKTKNVMEVKVKVKAKTTIDQG